MKYFRISFLILLVSVFTNCKKTSGGGDSTPVNSPPTNLTVSAVVNPDNSGNVTVTASATNAVSYDFDFGNGTYQTVPSGVVTYKYPASGNYTINVTAKSATQQVISQTTSVTVTVTLSLKWSEEFNVDGAPDGTKWGYDLGAGGWGNSELEYYTNRTDNAVVSNGTLKITAKKEAYMGSNYTSARLVTNGKFSFQYGRIEIRAKLPGVGNGTWPAIWMLGSDYATNAWPACGEMDIMEQKGSDPTRIYGTLHYPNHSGANGDGAQTLVATAASDFHVYSLDWSPAAMKISVDGNVFKTVNNSSSVPFNHNFFIILNLAMGGTFGGTIDPAFTSGTMEIDYVRVYQ